MNNLLQNTDSAEISGLLQTLSTPQRRHQAQRTVFLFWQSNPTRRSNHMNFSHGTLKTQNGKNRKTEQLTYEPAHQWVPYWACPWCSKLRSGHSVSWFGWERAVEPLQANKSPADCLSQISAGCSCRFLPSPTTPPRQASRHKQAKHPEAQQCCPKAWIKMLSDKIVMHIIDTKIWFVIQCGENPHFSPIY